MTYTGELPRDAIAHAQVDLPEPFCPRWRRLDGIDVQGHRLSVDLRRYFFSYESPTWRLCDWPLVRETLLGDPDAAVEQRTVDFVRAHGRITDDPAEVLLTGYEVYSHLFGDHRRDARVGDAHRRMLRELGTVLALNCVAPGTPVGNVGSAWFFQVAARTVFGVDDYVAERLHELYCGTFFDERRRAESIRAHAALGGPVVHGCSVPRGRDLGRYRVELAGSVRSSLWGQR